MAYVGNKPDVNYTSFQKQDLTGATGGTLTLSTPVTNANDIQLFINHVRQESGTSYTASGTTVTLQGYTVSASDDIYVIYHQAFQTTQPPDGSVNSAKLATDIAISGDLTVDTNTLKVDSSNNRVGIGTASPSRQVMISRSIADGSGELGIVSSDSSTTGALGNIHFGNSTDTSLASIRATADGATDAGKLEFNTEKTGAAIETALRIDSNGYVTTPLRPYFDAYGSSTQSWSGSSNYQTLQLSGVFENYGSHYNTSTYTFTVPVAGVYFFWYTYTNTTNSSSGPQGYIVYTPSGGSSSYRASAIQYNDYYNTVGNSAVINCAKNGTVVVKLYNNNDVSFSIDLSRSSFGGYLIG